MECFLNSKTELYAVIGDPISHSLSPDIHNRIYKRLKEDKAYLAMRIPPSELKASIDLLRNNFKGFNVTIPHKEAIIPYLDELDTTAEIYGAVNTVRVENGRLKGYNTDGYGFIMAMEAEGFKVEGKKVLLLGAGGAARVVAHELLNKGCHLTIANRSEEKRERLKAELLAHSSNKHIITCSPSELKEGYYCIVNTTPVGMAPLEQQLPLENLEILKASEVVFDLIYNPYKTLLLKAAEEAGCRVLNGFSMLYYQGIKAQEHWRGAVLPNKIAQEIFVELENMLK